MIFTLLEVAPEDKNQILNHRVEFHYTPFFLLMS